MVTEPSEIKIFVLMAFKEAFVKLKLERFDPWFDPWFQNSGSNFEFKKSVDLLRVPTHSATICIRFLNGQFSIVKLIEPFSGPYNV